MNKHYLMVEVLNKKEAEEAGKKSGSGSQEFKFVILFFTGEKCAPCIPLKKMLDKWLNENESFKKVFEIKLLYFDNEDHKKYFDKFNIKAVPALIIYNAVKYKRIEDIKVDGNDYESCLGIPDNLMDLLMKAMINH